MAGRRYTLTRTRGLDPDALIRAVCKLDLSTWPGRWRACLAVRSACELAATSDTWMWAYGLHLALAGHELGVEVGDASAISHGYQAGIDLLPAGARLVLDLPLGQRRAIGSMSPGRSWLS